MPHKKILIVDNEEDQRRLMKNILSKLGYSALAAADAEDTMMILETEEIVLVILDLIMTDIDGTELCEQIKHTHPDVVVYAFSGSVDLYGPDRLKRSGFDGFIEKPVRIHHLEEIIESVLSGRP